MVGVHKVSECSAWCVYASNSNWVVGIHLRLVLGVTDGDWDRGQHVFGKPTASTHWTLLDRYLVALRLMCVLFGSKELVCIRGWGVTVCD